MTIPTGWHYVSTYRDMRIIKRDTANSYRFIKPDGEIWRERIVTSEKDIKQVIDWEIYGDHQSTYDEMPGYREREAATKLAAEKVEAERLAEIQTAKDKVAADKAAAEAERLKREAEEAAKPPTYYDKNKDSQKQERDIALERVKPELEPAIMLEPEVVEPRPEPVKAPTEKASFIDTFIFELKSGWDKLMEMIQ